MYLQLHRLTIHLHSKDTLINEQWQKLLTGWLDEVTNRQRPFHIHFSLQLAQTLPPLPQAPPIFTDSHNWPDGVGVLTVYKETSASWQVGKLASATQHAIRNTQYLLHFQDGALVQVDVDNAKITGVVLPAALEYGRFQDITFTSLAPLLRRHGYYLVHAFATSKNGRAMLLVGPSGSGKTTAGLALVLDGWELLANDMVLLEKRPDGIYALPMPDRISIRPGTLDLLPGLRSLVGDKPIQHKLMMTGQALGNGRNTPPAFVSTIYFPQITGQAHTAVHPLSRAIALARLMEESLDRWDEAALPPHIELLHVLSQQTRAYSLQLGQDVAKLAGIIPNLTLSGS